MEKIDETIQTVEFFFNAAVKMVDDKFGAGSAKCERSVVASLVGSMVYEHRNRLDDIRKKDV